MIYWQLFYEFFLIGLFAIGGGMATLPFLRDLGARTQWFTAEQLIDMIAVSESTPGPIGINMATYVGYTTGGVPGSILATLAMVLPSLLIVTLIAKVLETYRESRLVQSVFYGIRPASVGLITAAALSIFVIAILQIDVFNATQQVIDLIRPKRILLAVALFLPSAMEAAPGNNHRYFRRYWRSVPFCRSMMHEMGASIR